MHQVLLMQLFSRNPKLLLDIIIFLIITSSFFITKRSPKYVTAISSFSPSLSISDTTQSMTVSSLFSFFRGKTIGSVSLVLSLFEIYSELPIFYDIVKTHNISQSGGSYKANIFFFTTFLHKLENIMIKYYFSHVCEID